MDYSISHLSIAKTRKENLMSELISIKSAANQLGVHTNTIHNWIRAGRIDAVKLSERTIRIAQEDINNMKGKK